MSPVKDGTDNPAVFNKRVPTNSALIYLGGRCRRGRSRAGRRRAAAAAAAKPGAGVRSAGLEAAASWGSSLGRSTVQTEGVVDAVIPPSHLTLD